VAADQQTGQHQIDDIILADHRLADFLPHACDRCLDLSKFHR
jgi:hypothetical protein